MALLLAVLVAVDARACSCAAPDVAAALRAGEAAFVGVVVARERVGTRHQEPLYDHTVRVVREYNVDLPARVRVRGGGQESACGVSFPVGRRVGMWVDEPVPSRIAASLCSLVSPDDLRRASQPLPAPRGTGRAALLVGARVGDDSTFTAYDARGRLLAYGYGGATVVAACPGGARFLQQATRGRRLLVRRTRDLRVLRTLEFPVRPADAVCRDRRARDVVALGSDSHTLARPGRLLTRAPGRGVIGFGRRDAVVVSGAEEQSRLRAVDLGSGAVRELGTFGGFPVSLTFAPDDRSLAFVTTGITDPDAPAHLSVLDMQTGALRQHEVAQADEGAIVWTGEDELLLVPGARSRPALRFRRDAEPLGTRPGLGFGSFAFVGGRLLQVEGGRLYGSTGGERRRLARLPSAHASSVVALPDRPSVRAPRRVPRRGGVAARAAARRCAR